MLNFEVTRLRRAGTITLRQTIEEPTYKRTVLLWKYLFTASTLVFIFFIGNRLRKQSYSDLGVI